MEQKGHRESEITAGIDRTIQGLISQAACLLAERPGAVYAFPEDQRGDLVPDLEQVREFLIARINAVEPGPRPWQLESICHVEPEPAVCP